MRKRFSRVEADVRRSDLIEATARVLGREGGAGVSVRAVAAEAGVSPGLITHYFAGVDALVARTYAEVGATVTALLHNATEAAGDDPRARLDAYVRASFAPPIADPALLATWLALWGLVPSSASVAAEHDRSYADYRAGLERLLAACGLPERELRLAAVSIAALVDGLWLELCLTPRGFTADEARELASRHVEALLGAAQRDKSVNIDR